jgi:DNA (cytosine-5)-methyltransferase 1
MRELSLFSGAGGGLLGSKLLGWQTVGCVEWEQYPQKVIRQRQDDGHLDTCPIFSNIDTFISEGYAESYQGLVDVVSGGWPCQPHSVAGKRESNEDDRDKWPAVKRCLEIIRPKYFFGENVPGILSSGQVELDHESAGHVPYIHTIFRELAEMGYDARWGVLGADDVGAKHKRKRFWIVAHTKHTNRRDS